MDKSKSKKRSVDADLKRVLDCDPMAETTKEMKARGLDSTTGEGRQARALFSLSHLLENSRNKLVMLEERDDSHGGIEYAPYCRILEEEHFERVYNEKFPGWPDEYEDYEIWWHPEGVLLTFETFTHKPGEQLKTITEANAFFNWERDKDSDVFMPPFATGGYVGKPGERSVERAVFVGHFNALEALRYKLAEARANGHFLPKWLESPLTSLNLSENQDFYSPDRDQYADVCKQRSQERFSKLPSDVFSSINVRSFWEQTTPSPSTKPERPEPEVSGSDIGY